MAVCVVVDNPNGSADIYDQVQAKLEQSGGMPPKGGLAQISGEVDGNWRVISVWESREAMEQFMKERLFPAFQALGLSQEGVSVSFFEAHSFMAADPAGAAASA